MIKKQVEESDFKTALTNGVFMFDKNGKKENQIRRIRCRESLKYESAVKVHTHSSVSDKKYKRQTLAVNGENTLCLFYKNSGVKAMSIQNIGKVAQSRIKMINNILKNHITTVWKLGKVKTKQPSLYIHY